MDVVFVFVLFVGGECAVAHLVEVEVGHVFLLRVFFVEEVVKHDAIGLPFVGFLCLVASIGREASPCFGVGFCCSPPLVMSEIAVEAEEVFSVLSVWDGHLFEAPRACWDACVY